MNNRLICTRFNIGSLEWGFLLPVVPSVGDRVLLQVRWNSDVLSFDAVVLKRLWDYSLHPKDDIECHIDCTIDPNDTLKEVDDDVDLESCVSVSELWPHYEKTTRNP